MRRIMRAWLSAIGQDVYERSGLVEGLPVLQLRIGICDDAAASLKVHLASEGDIGADHDARIHGSRGAEISDGSAVHSPSGRLQLRDNLHRAHLGRAGDGPPRKRGL